MTNEYAFWNAARPDAVKNPEWELDSGSLFARSGAGSTGPVDSVSPDATSSNGTGSAVFRLNTRRDDFQNVTVALDLDVLSQTSTASTPPVAWDGAHIWLRYENEYSLYAASVARRDGRIVVKKKCAGGSSNDGTYYELGPEVTGHPIPLGQMRAVSAAATNNADGSVTITMTIGGAVVYSATDRGIGCAPITAPGAVGLRGDNSELAFDNFRVIPTVTR